MAMLSVTPPDLTLASAVELAVMYLQQFGWLLGLMVGLSVGAVVLIWAIKEVEVNF